MQNYYTVLAAHKKAISVFVQEKSWTFIVLRKENMDGRKNMDCRRNEHLRVNSGIAAISSTVNWCY